MFKSYNTLIAGITGSGKSYLENLIIKEILKDPETQIVLIDPKMVELAEYENHPQTFAYSDDENGIYDLLCRMQDIMLMRYSRMKEAGEKATDENQIYIFVDEMAALLQSDRKKAYVQMFGKLAMLGRAAGIHLILCTQVATQDVIPAKVRDQMANIVCLRQYNKAKYHFLLGEAMPELSQVGSCYLKIQGQRIEKADVNDVWKKIMA